jgi:hypothetical protein
MAKQCETRKQVQSALLDDCIFLPNPNSSLCAGQILTLRSDFTRDLGGSVPEA